LEELRFIDKQKGASGLGRGRSLITALFSEELGSEVKSLGEYVFS